MFRLGKSAGKAGSVQMKGDELTFGHCGLASVTHPAGDAEPKVAQPCTTFKQKVEARNRHLQVFRKATEVHGII